MISYAPLSSLPVDSYVCFLIVIDTHKSHVARRRMCVFAYTHCTHLHIHTRRMFQPFLSSRLTSQLGICLHICMYVESEGLRKKRAKVSQILAYTDFYWGP